MKFSIKDFFSKRDQILNGKFHFFVWLVNLSIKSGAIKLELG